MEGLLSVRNPFPNWNHLSLFLPLAIDWNFCRLLFSSMYSLEQCSFWISVKGSSHSAATAAGWAEVLGMLL